MYFSMRLDHLCDELKDHYQKGTLSGQDVATELLAIGNFEDYCWAVTYVKEADVTMFEDKIVQYGSALQLFQFAKLPRVSVTKMEDALIDVCIKKQNTEYLILFAQEIAGANQEKIITACISLLVAMGELKRLLLLFGKFPNVCSDKFTSAIIDCLPLADNDRDRICILWDMIGRVDQSNRMKIEEMMLLYKQDFYELLHLVVLPDIDLDRIQEQLLQSDVSLSDSLLSELVHYYNRQRSKRPGIVISDVEFGKRLEQLGFSNDQIQTAFDIYDVDQVLPNLIDANKINKTKRFVK